jgi:superfamily II DNA or RNA helicase
MISQITIQVINPVFSTVGTAQEAIFLSGLLKYKSSYWKQGPFRKTEKKYEKSLVHKGKFLTGFIPMIKKYCDSKNVSLEIIRDSIIDIVLLGDLVDLEDYRLIVPKIPDKIKLEKDQLEVLRLASYYARGVVQHPTGSGKTVIFLSLISMFPQSVALIIVHTQELLLQTAEKASEFFPGQIGIIGGGNLQVGRVNVATIQTLDRLERNEQYNKFFESIDLVIVDEAHHLSKFSQPFEKQKSGIYSRVLSSIHAPIRLGFTATLPYIDEAKMALEGYIGPVISSTKPVEVDRLAKVRVVLKKLPITQTAKEAKNYQDVYKYGVVFNSRRHKQVLQTASNLVESNRTVLILVTLIQHGSNILTMARRSFPHLKIEYVHGQISGVTRNRIQKDLNDGRLDVVIADAVWKEGVDIPTLGSIINASGGKSEIQTVQSVGRGLRTVPGIKDDVILVDFFDPSHRYLVEHFGQRLTLYFEEGWMGNENY